MDHHLYEMFAIVAEATMVIMFHIVAHHNARIGLPAGLSIAALYLVTTSYYLWANIAPSAQSIA
jgi:hypothetical protein